MQRLIAEISASVAANDRDVFPQERSTPISLQLPVEWKTVRLQDIATISFSPYSDRRMSSIGQYPVYTMAATSSDTTDQFTHEGKSILLPAVVSGPVAGSKPFLRLVDGRFAVKGNLYVIWPQHEFMAEYLIRYMSVRACYELNVESLNHARIGDQDSGNSAS